MSSDTGGPKPQDASAFAEFFIGGSFAPDHGHALDKDIMRGYSFPHRKIPRMFRRDSGVKEIGRMANSKTAINIGIVGAGNIAAAMSKTVNMMDGVSLYAIASRDQEKAKAYQKKYGFAQAYGSYEDLYGDKNVDLVYVATPHSHHYEQMKMALDSGKHVLCEKAFTVNAAQAEEIIGIGRRKNLLVAEAIWTRYLPIRNMVNNIIAEGAIGRPGCLTSVFCACNANAERLVNPKLAGGSLLDLGVYNINFALMAFGDDIKEISASTVPHETGVDAADSITFIYNDGKMAMLHCNMFAAGYNRNTISGSRGYMEMAPVYNSPDIRIYDGAGRLVSVRYAPPQLTGYEYEVEACKKAIENGRVECEEMPHSEIIGVMKIMDSIRKIWGLRYPGEQIP
jgi:predicted dehydrogenase